jgi:transcriptional regulator with XRE-family HTH domain
MSAIGDLGEYIREQRTKAQVSLRQLAEQAGVSNPYLSQIERGLRKPSAEVLQQIATALRISTPVMYLRAGLLTDREGEGVLHAIAHDPVLNDRQRQILAEVYEAFCRENRASTVDESTVEKSVPAAARRVAQEAVAAAKGEAAPRKRSAPKAAVASKTAAPRKAAPRKTAPRKRTTG